MANKLESLSRIYDENRGQIMHSKRMSAKKTALDDVKNIFQSVTTPSTFKIVKVGEKGAAMAKTPMRQISKKLEFMPASLPRLKKQEFLPTTLPKLKPQILMPVSLPEAKKQELISSPLKVVHEISNETSFSCGESPFDDDFVNAFDFYPCCHSKHSKTDEKIWAEMNVNDVPLKLDDEYDDNNYSVIGKLELPDDDLFFTDLLNIKSGKLDADADAEDISFPAVEIPEFDDDDFDMF